MVAPERGGNGDGRVPGAAPLVCEARHDHPPARMRGVPAPCDLANAALDAVRAVARAHDLPVRAPVVLADGANLVVHLAPARVVAKAAASTRLAREPGAWLARELAVAAAARAAGIPAVAPAGAAEPRVYEHEGVAMTFWALVARRAAEPL